MGIIYEECVLVNRSPKDLSVQFDGQTVRLPPGENRLPVVMVSFAKNQNPIKGTQDYHNPHLNACKYLVGVKGKDDCTPLTEEEWADHLQQPMRVNAEQVFEEHYAGDPKAKQVVRGRGNTAAKSHYEAGGSDQGAFSLATFTPER